MTDIILKGQGVYYHKPLFERDPETGEMDYERPILDENGEQEYRLVPYTAPSRMDVCPWLVDPETGDMIHEVKTGQIENGWALERAAKKLAHDYMSQYNVSFEVAHKKVKELMNKSALEFNRTHRGKGIPLYFDMDSPGQPLNPKWAHLNGGDYPKSKQTENMPTHNKNGLITYYKNSKDKTGHGDVFESAAFPSWREFGKLVGQGSAKEEALHNGTYIPTRIGTYGHIEPQDTMHDIEGRGDVRGGRGVVHRFSATSVAPDSPLYSDVGTLAARKQIHALDSLGGLDSSFFHPKEGDYGTPYAEKALLERGYTAPVPVPDKDGNYRGETRSMASIIAATPAGAFFNQGRVTGARNAVDANILQLYGKVMSMTGQSFEEVQHEQQSLVRGHQSHGMQELGIHNGNGDKLLQALAISQMVREAGASTDPSTIENHHHASFSHLLSQGGKRDIRQAMLEPRELSTLNIDTSHITPENSVMSSEMYSPSFAPTGDFDPGVTNRNFVGAGANPGLSVTTSDQSLYDLMESLQLADAKMDMELRKSLPQWADNESLCEEFSLTANDLKFIFDTRGDWHAIAKTLMIDPRVVSLVKLSRGALI